MDRGPAKVFIPGLANHLADVAHRRELDQRAEAKQKLAEGRKPKPEKEDPKVALERAERLAKKQANDKAAGVTRSIAVVAPPVAPPVEIPIAPPVSNLETHNPPPVPPAEPPTPPPVDPSWDKQREIAKTETEASSATVQKKSARK